MEAGGAYRLRIAGHIADYAPGGQRDFELPADARTLRLVLMDLGLNPDLVRSVLAGGRRVSLDFTPAAGEEVVLLAPAAGG